MTTIAFIMAGIFVIVWIVLLYKFIKTVSSKDKTDN